MKKPRWPHMFERDTDSVRRGRQCCGRVFALVPVPMPVVIPGVLAIAAGMLGLVLYGARVGSAAAKPSRTRVLRPTRRPGPAMPTRELHRR